MTSMFAKRIDVFLLSLCCAAAWEFAGTKAAATIWLMIAGGIWLLQHYTRFAAYAYRWASTGAEPPTTNAPRTWKASFKSFFYAFFVGLTLMVGATMTGTLHRGEPANWALMVVGAPPAALLFASGWRARALIYRWLGLLPRLPAKDALKTTSTPTDRATRARW